MSLERCTQRLLFRHLWRLMCSWWGTLGTHIQDRSTSLPTDENLAIK